MVIWGKRTCPITRCVHFLECPLIRGFTAFVRFPFSRAWAAISTVFLERLLYLSLSFPKKSGLFDMVDSEWNGTREISHYFVYQRAKLFTGKKITYTISIYLQNTWYMSPSPKPFGNEIKKIVRTCYPPVPNNPPTLPQLSSRTSTGRRKNFYLYLSINSWFFTFCWTW